jgi:predicted homoserine dehydrogenase-like protein
VRASIASRRDDDSYHWAFVGVDRSIDAYYGNEASMRVGIIGAGNMGSESIFRFLSHDRMTRPFVLAETTWKTVRETRVVRAKEAR